MKTEERHMGGDGTNGMDEVLWQDATGQAELIRQGEISADELFDAAVQRLERVDQALAVLVHRRYDAARRELAEVEEGMPFAGVPMVLKDLIAHMAGEPFHESIAGVARRGYVAEHDTELVRRFRAAGLVILGITKTPELGTVPLTEPVLHGPTRNPWDPQRSTMGSSGGSAAAVAAGAVAIGHGNDLGGSLRTPAASCGIVGLKPSRGRVSLAPDFGDLVNGFVAEFAMTRSVRDAAALLQAVSGTAAGDPYTVDGPTDFLAPLAQPSTGLRIGLHPVADRPAHIDAVRHAGKSLEALGHQVEESHPPALDESEIMLRCAEVIFTFAEYALTWWHRTLGEPLTADDVEPYTWWLAEQSRQRTPADYLGTVEWIQSWSRRVASWWGQGHDLLITPTLATLPPEIGAYRFDPENPLSYMIGSASHSGRCMDWNLTGSPAISIPAGMADGLPIGIQLVAPLGMDRTLIDVAAQLEQAIPWHDRRPPGW